MEKTVELIICVILPIHTPIGSKRRTIDGPQQNNPVNALFCATYSLVGETLTRSRANEGLPRERGVRKEEPSRREEWNIVASERYTRETDAVPGIRFMSDWNMYDPFLSDGKKIIITSRAFYQSGAVMHLGPEHNLLRLLLLSK